MTVLVIFIIAGLYLLIGMFAYVTTIQDFIDIYDANPLWKLPALILWPMAFVFVLGFMIAKFIIDYREEIERWYARKREEKGE